MIRETYCKDRGFCCNNCGEDVNVHRCKNCGVYL
jgi:hypothetical protein